ncbi:hypothetical protein, partial [uncultured Dokdonia sp.]|uniref:hypothetical protein n=1 Tax=uncultured Dokdonia sp. TaxID=575653 RepID=UPI002612E132
IDSQTTIENDALNQWLLVDLNTVIDQNEMNYPIGTKRLYELSTIKGVTDIQFMPGIIQGELTIRVMAVNRNTNTVLAEETLFLDNKEYILPIIKDHKNKYPVLNSSLQKDILTHRLSHDQAVNYISNWTKKSMSEIDEITSFNG